MLLQLSANEVQGPSCSAMLRWLTVKVWTQSSKRCRLQKGLHCCLSKWPVRRGGATKERAGGAANDRAKAGTLELLPSADCALQVQWG